MQGNQLQLFKLNTTMGQWRHLYCCTMLKVILNKHYFSVFDT